MKKIDIVYLELERDGWVDMERNLIVVNSNLPEEEQEQVILHELGHFLKHQGKVAHYNVCGGNKVKMEGEADRYMIDELIERLAKKFNLCANNWQAFMQQYHIEGYLEDYVMEKFSKYDSY